jgi:hypothetical protein
MNGPLDDSELVCKRFGGLVPDEFIAHCKRRPQASLLALAVTCPKVGKSLNLVRVRKHEIDREDLRESVDDLFRARANAVREIAALGGRRGDKRWKAHSGDEPRESTIATATVKPVEKRGP